MADDSDQSAGSNPLAARSSVFHLHDYWYVACRSTQLKAKPLARTLMGTPIVLFRDGEGSAGALLDRCPHRNAPLSFGRLADGQLQCGYHGWRFDRQGRCMAVPGLCAPSEAKGRQVDAYATAEHDGFVWVFGRAGAEPEAGPFRFPHLDDSRYTSVRQEVEAQGSVFASIENALDVPHTAFLHEGLFRSSKARNSIEAVVRADHRGVEAEYIGEPRPSGLAARILAPQGGTVTHFDRFILPSISQVEYRLGEHNHVVVSAAMTPVSDFHTRLHAVVSYRLRIPGWLVRPFIQPIANRIFAQDAEVLKLQTENIQRFGGESFSSTEVDVLGLHIAKLMRQAAAGKLDTTSPPVQRRIKMEV